jgi:hypothetical protein
VPNPNCAKRQRACRRRALALSTGLIFWSEAVTMRLIGARALRAWSMIRKSGYRFSGKIMLQLKI